MEYPRCTHVREFQALQRRAESAELREQQLRETIGHLRDNEAFLKRRVTELQRALEEATRPCP